MAPVVQYQQARVNCACRFHIHIINIINSLVERGIGIQILTELHTDTLQILLQPVAGEMRSTIEAHMLQEMSQTTLVLLLLNRTHLLGNVEVAAFLRPLIVADVIGEAIGQNANLYGWIKRNIGHLLSRNSHNCCHESKQNNVKSFFHNTINK